MRKFVAIGLVVALALVAGAAITGVTMAQQGRFTHIASQTDGDERVVAVVEGRDLTAGDVRRSTSRNQAIDPSLTETAAKQEILYIEVERRILDSAVAENNFVPSDEEVEEYMAPIIAGCSSEDGTECQRYMREMGYDDADEFWADAASDYKSQLGQMKLIRTTLESRGSVSENTTPDEFFSQRLAYVEGLHKEADIVWHDKELEKLYNQQVAERTSG